MATTSEEVKKFLEDIAENQCKKRYRFGGLGSKIGSKIKEISGIADGLNSGNCPLELELDLTFNDLNPEAAKLFAKALQSGKCPQGLKVELGHNEFGSEGATWLAEALQSSNCPQRLELGLNFTCLGSEGAKQLAIALQSGKCPQGLRLNLEANRLGLKEAKLLVEALQSGKCPQGLTLDLGHNYLGAEGATWLAEVLQSGKCPPELTLDLGFNQLGFEAARLLAGALQSGNCPRELTLDLSNNSLGSEGAKLLAEALKSGKCPHDIIIKGVEWPGGKSGEEECLRLMGITSKEVKKLLEDAAKNQCGTYYSFYDKIRAKEISAIANVLSSGNCPQKLMLWLWNKNLGPEVAKPLATALQSGKCPQELSLYLSGNDLGPEGAKLFAEALQSGNCPQKLHVDLGKNKLGPKGAELFAKALQSGKCPQGLTLDLSDNEGGPEVAKPLAAALQSGECPQGLSLYLSSNGLSLEEIKRLAEALQFGKCPQGLTLSVSNNNLGSEVAKPLAVALQSGKCPQGLSLYLSGNDLGPEGAKLLAEALQFGNCPQELRFDLGKNKFGPKGAELFAKALQFGKCPQGLKLYLTDNDLGPEGAKLLAEALQSGNCPQELHVGLGKNKLGPKGAELFAKALQSGKCPRGLKLYLADNDMDPEAVKPFAEALQSGNCPQGLEFDLRDNKLGHEGIKRLAEALQSGKCPPGLWLGLWNTDSGSEGARLLVEVLQSGKCPQAIVIKGIEWPGGESGQTARAVVTFGEAWHYEQGVGVKQDLNKALELYEQAAKLGHREAQQQVEKLKEVLRSELFTQVSAVETKQSEEFLQLSKNRDLSLSSPFSSPVASIQSEIGILATELLAEKQENLFQGFLYGTGQLIVKHKISPRTCFISYAWEDESTSEGRKKNKQLQNWLARLSKDLKKVGVRVHLDIEEMQGEMDAWMKKGIVDSDHILLIGTPRYKTRALQQTNVAFELKLIREKVESAKAQGNTNVLLPLLYQGDFSSSFPEGIAKYLIRDFRKPQAYYRLIGGYKKPLGLILDIYSEFGGGGKYHSESLALFQRFKAQFKLIKIKTQQKLGKIEEQLTKLPKSFSLSSLPIAPGSYHLPAGLPFETTIPTSSSSSSSSSTISSNGSCSVLSFPSSGISLPDQSNAQRSPLVLSISSSSSSIYPALKPSLKVTPEEIQKFLNHVATGEQDEAEAMLKKSSELALASGTVTDHAKRTFKNITGFQYAVWALDWQMWKMIKSYLPKEDAQEQARGFAEGPWVAKYGEHANWKKLTEAQKTLIDNWYSWNWKKVNDYWVQQVSWGQLLLPAHVLQEYNRFTMAPKPCPQFDIDYTLTRVRSVVIGVLLQHIFSRCGTATAAMSEAELSGLILHDQQALNALMSTRIQQRAELVAELVKERGFSPLAPTAGLALSSAPPLRFLTLPSSSSSSSSSSLSGVASSSFPASILQQKKQETGPEEDVKERGEQRGFAFFTSQYQAQLKPTLKVTPEDVQTFLNHIVSGKQNEAEAMLKKNQDLVLAAGTVTDHAKRMFKNITGFQYAVWALDWQMWKMTRKYLSVEAAQEQARGLAEGSWVAEHGEYVDLKKLIEAQQTLIDNWGWWDWLKADEHWIQQIGRSQRLLPMHLLQEYTQPGRPFHPCPIFDADYNLVRDLGSLRINELGRTGGYVRGSRETVGRCCAWPDILEEVQQDALAIARLFSIRTQQRAQMVTELLEKIKLENSVLEKDELYFSNPRQDLERKKQHDQPIEKEVPPLRFSTLSSSSSFSMSSVLVELKAQEETNRVLEEEHRHRPTNIRSLETRVAQMKAELAQKEKEEKDTSERFTAEAERIKAETAQIEAENARKEAEHARLEAEAERMKVGIAQQKAEQARLSAEVERIQAETARLKAEDAQKAERIKAETARLRAADVRVEAEKARLRQEIARIEAENARKEKEHKRELENLEKEAQAKARLRAEAEQRKENRTQSYTSSYSNTYG